MKKNTIDIVSIFAKAILKQIPLTKFPMDLIDEFDNFEGKEEFKALKKKIECFIEFETIEHYEVKMVKNGQVILDYCPVKPDVVRIVPEGGPEQSNADLKNLKNKDFRVRNNKVMFVGADLSSDIKNEDVLHISYSRKINARKMTTD
jgi:hypothetical protein